MVGVGPEDLVESIHGGVVVSEDGLEGCLGGHDVEDEALGFSGAIAEGEAVFICVEGFFELMCLKEFGSLLMMVGLLYPSLV